MLPPVPNILDYGISPSRGFLPPSIPLSRLPNAYYDPWESVIQSLQPLILTKRLRSFVDRLPILSTQYLEEEAEWRRAYVVLSFLAHGYVWAGEFPQERVPPSISKPYKEVCEHFELPTVATYSAVCLWNWRPILEGGEIDDLMNLASLHTFTGSSDETWFYTVSVAIEARGAHIIPIMLKAIEAARHNDSRTVAGCLQMMAEYVDEIGTVLNRMYEECSPEVFYQRIRPYLAGSKNMGEAGLPNGVIFDTGSGDDVFVHYGGGSNAQSSLIQFFDVVLGVEHRPTGQGQDDRAKTAPGDAYTKAQGPTSAPPSNNFINDMRAYMPGAHRRFLYDVEAVANIREYVHANKDDQPLVLAYDASLAMLRSLRDKHIQMVSRYIIIQSRESRSISPRGPPNIPTKKRLNLANVQQQSNVSDKKGLRGTGGTALIPFLKQARDETSEGVVDQWAKRLLGEVPVTSRKHDANKHGDFGTPGQVDPLAPEGAPKIVGMAGTWAADESEGGICHW